MGEEFLRWQVRDREEYLAFRQYIQKNPVKSALTHTQEEYRYSSSGSSVALDGVPQCRLHQSRHGRALATGQDERVDVF